MQIPGGGLYDLCTFCPSLCQDRCPVVAATASVTLSPQNKMSQGWLLARGQVPADDEVARTLYQCTGCLACHDACRHEVDVERGLFSLRAALVAEGVTPFGLERFEEDDSALVQAQRDAIPAEYFVPEAQAVLFAGCAALRDSPSVATDAFRAFKALGIEFVGVSDDAALCCGYPLYAGGYLQEFTFRARRVVSELRRYKTVVVLSPCCLYTLRTLYAAANVESIPRTLLALDLVAPLVEREARKGLGRRLAYHDNCFLGRHLDQYDLPRKVLTRVNGTPPVELRRARKDAMCCGAGGGWDRVAPGPSTEAARNLLEMAADAGVATVASSTCRCTAHLDQAGHDKVRVVDLMTLVADWAEQAPR